MLLKITIHYFLIIIIKFGFGFVFLYEIFNKLNLNKLNHYLFIRILHLSNSHTTSLLQKQFNECQEPNEKKINEFAELIGINVEKEHQLLYLAREGQKAPLPRNWVTIQADQDDVYYLNTETNERSRDHPLIEKYRQIVIEERDKLKYCVGSSQKEMILAFMQSADENITNQLFFDQNTQQCLPSKPKTLIVDNNNQQSTEKSQSDNEHKKEKDQESNEKEKEGSYSKNIKTEQLQQSNQNQQYLQLDEDWIPNEYEIKEYAEYIGIDVKKEPHLMYLALEGLKVPLPPNWVAANSQDNEVYYQNIVTNETLQDHPCDEQYRQRVMEERVKIFQQSQSSEDQKYTARMTKQSEKLVYCTYSLEQLKTLPKVFNQSDDYYFTLIDLTYTDRYSQKEQYEAIIQYGNKNQYFINIQFQLSTLNNKIQPIQLINCMLLVIQTHICSKQYSEAIEFVQALLNDITNQTQESQIGGIIQRITGIDLNVKEIFQQQLSNVSYYVTLSKLILSVLHERLNDYNEASKALESINDDVSIAIALLRLKFNIIFSSQISIPLHQIVSQLLDLDQYCKEILEKQFTNNFFNYGQMIIKYVINSSRARICTLLQKFEQADNLCLELLKSSSDIKSYNDTIAIYLDSLCRQAIVNKQNVQLLTYCPIILYQMQSKDDVLCKAIQIAVEMINDQDHLQTRPIVYYYLALYYVLKKKLRKALEFLELCKKSNKTEYLYICEMVILTWLPQILDFDIHCIQIMLNSQETLTPNIQDNNYFQKLNDSNSVLLMLSPDRAQLCMALQVLMDVQIFQFDVINFVNLLANAGFIDESFGYFGETLCVQKGKYSCNVIEWIFGLAVGILKTYPKLSMELESCVQRQKEFHDEFKDVIYELPKEAFDQMLNANNYLMFTQQFQGNLRFCLYESQLFACKFGFEFEETEGEHLKEAEKVDVFGRVAKGQFGKQFLVEQEMVEFEDFEL